MAPSNDPGALDGDLTVEKRLRLNATAICRQTGGGSTFLTAPQVPGWPTRRSRPPEPK